MKFELPKIYPITDVFISKLSHLEQVELLISGGAKLIQLRDKYAAPKDFYAAAKEVIKFARPKKVKIIINDRVDIALAADADGVHLGQDDLPPEQARKILGEKAIIGCSTHSIDQIAEAVKFPVDYLAIGPIFPTTSKENPETVVGIEIIKEIRRVTGELPLVAIGGITFENAASVFESGADSIALISAILNPSTQIVENIRKFYRAAC
ncbi:MAG: thiamine phosphate synthase [Pyrinomonadaceae bacterium]